jgi:lipid-A-disaccharide synthase-like uncharacterized protein
VVALVRILQLLSAAAWALPLVLHAPSAWRVLHGTSRGEDLSWSFVCLNGAMQIGFVIRWFMWRGSVQAMLPAELFTWSLLYLVSIGVAIGTFWTITARQREQK